MFKSTKKAYVYFQPEQSPDSTDNRDEERVDDHQLCLFVMWNDATIAEYVASTCPRNIFEYTVEIRQVIHHVIKIIKYLLDIGI